MGDMQNAYPCLFEIFTPFSFNFLLQIYLHFKICYDISAVFYDTFSLKKKCLQTLILSELFNISKHFILL